MKTNLQDSQLLDQFQTLLTITAKPEIATPLATFAYTDASRQTDQTLLDQTRRAFETQQKETAESRAATQAEDQIQATARAAFLQLHALIRLADRTNPQLDIKQILETGILPQTETKFLTYTTALLSRLQNQPDILTALNRFGFTPERITELQTLLENVRQADITQEQEQNEAKQATQIYRERIAQVRLSHSILTTLAQQALANQPDLLKLLP